MFFCFFYVVILLEIYGSVDFFFYFYDFGVFVDGWVDVEIDGFFDGFGYFVLVDGMEVGVFGVYDFV